MSSRPSSWRLPPELTKAVFELVQSDATTWHGTFYGDLRAIMLVCSNWKTIGQDILYERVYVRHDSTIHKLANRLKDAHLNPGQRIRHLTIDRPEPAEREPAQLRARSDVVASMLFHTPHLLSYSTGFRIPTPMELTCLAQMCSTTLTSLVIMADLGTHGIFPVVNTLFNLEYLKISFEGSGWGHLPEFPLCLPKLTDFHWEQAVDEEANLFLAGCRFGPKCYIHLALDAEDAESLVLVKPLFTHNDFREACLELPDKFWPVLAANIVAIPRLDIGGIPPLEFANSPYLPPWVTFCYMRWPGHSEKLVASIQALASSAIKPRGQRTTIVISLDFTWAPVDAEGRVLLDELLSYACVLWERGIVIMDEEGRDMTAFAYEGMHMQVEHDNV